MPAVLIGAAFAFGMLGRTVGLPPLVGFLIAGFALQALGFEKADTIETFADLGVTLLLFSIGLKLRVRTLLRPEIWAGATVHMGITVGALGLGLFALAQTGLPPFAALDLPLALLVAFALSFSSTVFAVKVLEERGEMGAMHGRVSIGILIMQDVIAVVFLTASLGKMPSVWALGLLALPLARPLLFWLMDRAGHGELLLLFGLVLALLVGAEGFELVGMKADLGALILGMLVGDHPKSSEMSKTLLSLKELFLVAFFLNIGLSGQPSLSDFGVAAVLVTVVPLKVALFFGLLTRFRLRARTSVLAALSLANYSEFGLIVAAIGVAQGWIAQEWLTILAISLSMTFIIAAPLNTYALTIYARISGAVDWFETDARHPDDELIDVGDAEILIFGMGRVGTGAYEEMRRRYGDVVLGLDADPEAVAAHRESGRNVIRADATDSDFWQKVRPSGRVRLVMLSMPKHPQNMYAVEQLARVGFPGLIGATAVFDDQRDELEAAGVHACFNFYTEAGTGFADHVAERLEATAERPD